jgi:hypothetical protein
MPRKIKSNKRRAGLDADAQAWLRGEIGGYSTFKRSNELEPLWTEYGDKDSMFWKPGMPVPKTIHEMDD